MHVTDASHSVRKSGKLSQEVVEPYVFFLKIRMVQTT